MPISDCLTKISVPEKIKDKLNKSIDEYRSNGLDPLSAERKALLDYHKELHNDLNDLRVAVGEKPVPLNQQGVDASYPKVVNVKPKNISEPLKPDDNAIPIQEPSQGVLQSTQSQLGLPQMGEGNTGHQESAGTQGQSGGAQTPPAEPQETVTGNTENPVTSIKNAVTAQRIEDFGLRPAQNEAMRQFGPVWEEAKSKIENGYDVDGLIKALLKKPRSLTDTEDAMILHKQIEKEAALMDINNQIDTAADRGDRFEVEEKRLIRGKLRDDLQDIYDAGKGGGRETARGLNARKMMADLKYSLVNMRGDMRAAQGGTKLSEEQEAFIQKRFDAIQKANQQLEDRVKKLEAQLAAKPKKTIKQSGKELADKIRKFRPPSSGTLQSNLFGLGVAAYDTAIVTIANLVEAGATLADAVEKVVKSLKFPTDKDKNDFIEHLRNIEPPEVQTEKKPKAFLPTGKNPEEYKQWIKDKAAVEREKGVYEQQVAEIESEHRKWYEKVMNGFVKLERAYKLSSPITIAKLTAAALTRAITEIPEEIIGGAYSQLPFLKKAGEAGINVKAIAAGYKAMFTEGMKDAYDTMSNKSLGKSDLDIIFGKNYHLPPEMLEFFGRLHSMLKAPVKRFAFERALQKRLANAIKNGVDVSDPLVQMSILNNAFKAGQRAIFMQDNFVSDSYLAFVKMLERDRHYPALSKGAAAFLQWMIPFVKVPTNIVGETAVGIGGLEYEAGKIIYKTIQGGLKNMSPDEKDLMIRNLRKGTIGTVMLLLGYFKPQMFGGYYLEGEKHKKGELKAGQIKIGDHVIPMWLLESPIFQVAQFGATVRKMKDKIVKGQPQGIGEGVIAASLGLAAHEPLFEQPKQFFGAITSGNERKYYFGELAKNSISPALLQSLATRFDPADKRPLFDKMMSPENQRSPQTMMDHIKSGIPWLREQVPVKKSGSRRGRR